MVHEICYAFVKFFGKTRSNIDKILIKLISNLRRVTDYFTIIYKILR